jgi:N-dimethylarginine dimethylaminohydrolase
MKTIVMCPPDAFDVNYVINPWMEGNTHKVDHDKAVIQWMVLREALRAAGAKVWLTPIPPKDCPDAVFTANAGLAFKGTFVPSYFRYKERFAEEPFFINEAIGSWHLRLDGMDIPGTREQQSFEGAGDALYDRKRDILWMGFGFRTQLGFKPVLEAALENYLCTVRPLQLVDPRWYHLDTCFCPLDNGQLLWYPEAFAPYSQYTIKTWYPDAIAVSEEDALRFACNAVSVDDHLVLPRCSDELKQRVEREAGVTVMEVNMSQYLRSGGAAKCLTLELIE